MEVDKKAVGQRIKSIRLEKGMTLEEFGKIVDTPPVKPGIISRWENGTSLPNAERLKQISKIADMSVDELLYGSVGDFVWFNVKNIFDSIGEPFLGNIVYGYLVIDIIKQIESLNIEASDFSTIQKIFCDAVPKIKNIMLENKQKQIALFNSNIKEARNLFEALKLSNDILDKKVIKTFGTFENLQTIFCDTSFETMDKYNSELATFNSSLGFWLLTHSDYIQFISINILKIGLSNFIKIDNKYNLDNEMLDVEDIDIRFYSTIFRKYDYALALDDRENKTTYICGVYKQNMPIRKDYPYLILFEDTLFISHIEDNHVTINNKNIALNTLQFVAPLFNIMYY